jgi:septum formation protein
LILASASPRRRFLLRLLDTPFLIRVSGIPERRLPRESPRALALRLALCKAEAVARVHPRARVLGSDTVVCVGSRVLGTPRNRREAAVMLGLLSGRRHRVWTGVALLEPGRRPRRFAACTRVSVAPLSAADRRAYLESGEWRGKAGAYGIQGRFAAWVRRIDGSYTNVVGLPLEPVRRLLRGGRHRGAGRSPDRQADSGRQRRRGRRAAATSSRRRTGVR